MIVGRDHRRVGVHRGRAAAAVRRPPRARRRRAPPATPRRAPRSPTCTRAWPPPTRTWRSSTYDPSCVDGARPGLPRPAPRRSPGARARRCVEPGGRGRRPGRRLPAARPGAVPARGTARSTPRPSCSTDVRLRPARAVPRRDRRRRRCRRARLLPDRRRLALAPLVRAGAGRADRHRGRRRQRRVGRRPARSRPPPPSAPSTRTSPPTACSTTATRPRSSRPRAARPGAVHAPPGPDEPGHPGHLLRPADRAGRRRPTTLLGMLRDAYAGEPFVVVVDELAVHQGHARLEHRPPHRPVRRAHRLGGRACAAIDNLVKGASGQAVQCANLVLGLARDRRPPDRRGSTRERRPRPEGFVAAGVALRHQGRRRRPTWPWWPPPTARPVAGGRRVHAEPADRRAGRASAARHLAATGGRAAAVVLNSGNANAATGEQGVADAERDVRARRRRARVPRRTRCWCARPGSSASRCRWTRSRPGIPPLVAARRDRRRHRRAAEAILTTDTVRKEVGRCAGDGFTVGGMAKGAAMLAPDMATMLAVLTTDAARRPGRAAGGAAGRRWPAVVQRPDRSTAARRPTTPCSLLASGRAGAGRPDAARDGGRRGVRSTWPRQMAGDAEGATKVVPRPGDRGGVRRRGPPGGPQGGREPARASARGTAQDPYWGRIASELGSAGRRASTRDRCPSPTAADRGRRAAWPPTTTPARWPPTWRARTSRSPLDLGLGDGRAGHPHQRPHPRLHRREHGHVVTAERGRDRDGRRRRRRPPGRGAGRGAALHPAVLGAPSSS